MICLRSLTKHGLLRIVLDLEEKKKRGKLTRHGCESQGTVDLRLPGNFWKKNISASKLIHDLILIVPLDIFGSDVAYVLIRYGSSLPQVIFYYREGRWTRKRKEKRKERVMKIETR